MLVFYYLFAVPDAYFLFQTRVFMISIRFRILWIIDNDDLFHRTVCIIIIFGRVRYASLKGTITAFRRQINAYSSNLVYLLFTNIWRLSGLPILTSGQWSTFAFVIIFLKLITKFWHFFFAVRSLFSLSIIFSLTNFFSSSSSYFTKFNRQTEKLSIFRSLFVL